MGWGRAAFSQNTPLLSGSQEILTPLFLWSLLPSDVTEMLSFKVALCSVLGYCYKIGPVYSALAL